MQSISKTKISTIRPSDLRVSGRTLDQFKANLKIGDSMRGRVVGYLGENRALVNFKGFNIVTEMGRIPRRGELLQARILSIDEQITMRLTPTEPSIGVKSATRIADLLTSQGLSVTNQTEMIAKTLLQHNIPVTQANIESLIQYTASFSTPANLPMDVFTFAWMLRIPPDSHLFDALRSLLGDGERIGAQLQNLRSLLSALISEVPDDLHLVLLENLMQAIEEMYIQAPERGRFAFQIQRFMEQLGLGYEAMLLAAKNPDLIRKFLQYSHSSLKGMLLRLRTQAFASQSQNKLPESTQERLNQLVDVLDGILINVDAHELAMHGENQVYLQVPYWMGDHLVTAEILGRSPQNGLDPENMQLELLVNTVNLGTLKIHLNVFQRQMNCAISTESPQSCAFIEEHKGDLMSRMKALNYTLKDIHLRVANPDELHLDPIFTLADFEGDLVKINVTA